MTYQFNAEMLPDSSFLPGHLKYIVPGNECRLLDPRRTPLRVLEVNGECGFFIVEIEDFEDKGGRWELPLECVDLCQFAQGSAEANNATVDQFAAVIDRLNLPVEIPANLFQRDESEASIAALRTHAGNWLKAHSSFIASGTPANFSSPTGSPELWADLQEYMALAGLAEMEAAFADHYVRSFNFGEVLKGHGIVLAEMGLVSFTGKQVRNPNLFQEPWSKSRRSSHILHRLAFLRELFAMLGYTSLILYRGFSCEGTPQLVSETSFVSATFKLEVATHHFNERDRARTGVLLRQAVPVERLFMSFLETEQMNRNYKESEAVLLKSSVSSVF